MNEAHAEWNDPTTLDEKYTDSVWNLWDKAMVDGEAVLVEAIKFLHNKPNELADVLGNVSYETGKPCDSGLKIRYVNPMI